MNNKNTNVTVTDEMIAICKRELAAYKVPAPVVRDALEETLAVQPRPELTDVDSVSVEIWREQAERGEIANTRTILELLAIIDRLTGRST